MSYVSRGLLRGLTFPARVPHRTLQCTRRVASQAAPLRTPYADVSGPLYNVRCFSHRTRPHIVAEDQTIYALSTRPGQAAIAVIRISGPASKDIYLALCRKTSLPKPHHAVVRTLYEPSHRAGSELVLDTAALVLFFHGPSTVTGQDILELHVHGGTATVKAVLAAIPLCSSDNRIRYAEPGEFTRRAFANARLDFAQIEALGDTLSATTEQQRRLSVRGSSGALGRQYETWRHELLLARGELEALIDFSEDQHFVESPLDLLQSVANQAHRLRKSLDFHAANAVRGELLRDGINISLLGAPNAGKSSLLNRIVGREAAIVSPEAGTTRDIIEVGLDIGGYLCRFGDTAGIRSIADNRAEIGSIEQEGIRRATAKALDSDVVLMMLSFEEMPGLGRINIACDSEVINVVRSLNTRTTRMHVVVNKLDLRPEHMTIEQITSRIQDILPGVARKNIHCITCKASDSDLNSGSDGVASLLTSLIDTFSDMTEPGLGESADASDELGSQSLGASQRHRLLLEECSAHLRTFTDALDVAAAKETDNPNEGDIDVVVLAESLRAAASCLGRITGKGLTGDVEEVLGVVFEKFCVGK